MADYKYIHSSGVIVPDLSDTRNQVIAEFRAVFGADLATDPSTPQGKLITRIAEERDALARNNAEMANQINPDIAGGVALDALWRLTGGSRRGSVRSSINGVVMSGVPGTLIPAGSRARSQAGDLFSLKYNRVIGSSGSVLGEFVALEPGPIRVPENGLDTVASSVLGWETVTNPNPSIPGRFVESDAESRRRRRQTLGLHSVSVDEAIVSRLYDLPLVRSLNFLENDSDEDRVIEGIPMRKHSIWVCVEGGIDSDIAQALRATKTVGAGYNGDVVVEVPDRITGRPYEVKFDRPDVINLMIRVRAKASSLDLTTLIPELIMNYVEGRVEGDVSFVVGSDVSPWEIAGTINQQEPSITVRKVELSVAGTGNWSTDVFTVGAKGLAKTQLSSIQVLLE